MFKGKFVQGMFIKTLEKLLQSSNQKMLFQSLDLYFKMNPSDGAVLAKLFTHLSEFPVERKKEYLQKMVENYYEIEEQLTAEGINLNILNQELFQILTENLSDEDNFLQSVLCCKNMIRYTEKSECIFWYDQLRNLYVFKDNQAEISNVEKEACRFVAKNQLEMDFLTFGEEWLSQTQNEKSIMKILSQGFFLEDNLEKCEKYLLRMIVLEPENNIYQERLFEIFSKNGLLERLCDLSTSGAFKINIKWAEEFFQVYLRAGRFVQLFNFIESDQFEKVNIYPKLFHSMEVSIPEDKRQVFFRELKKFYVSNFQGMKKFQLMLSACALEAKNLYLIECLFDLTELLQHYSKGFSFLEFLINHQRNPAKNSEKMLSYSLQEKNRDYALKALNYIKIHNAEKEIWSLCDNFLATFPDENDGIVLCADLYFSSGTYQKDRHNLSAMDFSRKPHQFVVEIASRLMKKDNLQEARFFLEKIPDFHQYDDVLIMLLDICNREGNLEKYYYYLQCLCLGFSGYREKFDDLLIWFREIADMKVISNFFELYSQSGKEDPHLSALIVEKYLQQEKFNECLEILKKLNGNYQGKNIPVLFNLGLCSLKLSEIPNATRYFDSLIELTQQQENYREILLEIGKICYDSGNFKIAANYLKPLNNMNPPDPEAKNLLKLCAQMHQNVKASQEASPQENEGKRIFQKRYEILKMIGEGGMGIVYQAKDLKLQREIAIKILHKKKKDFEKALERFKQEAMISARLNHENVIRVYDVDYQDPAYITMEFVDGKSLRQLLKESTKIPLIQAKTLILQMLDGLAHIHKNGVVHRDIKPDNIMLNNSRTIKIMDLGLAVILSSDYNRKEIMGTGWYMSPEQFKGESVTSASDIYSFGMMIFELLTGRVPFCRGNIAYRQINEHPPQPRNFNSLIPKDLDELILKCIEKKPENRFQSIAELKEKFQKIAFI